MKEEVVVLCYDVESWRASVSCSSNFNFKRFLVSNRQAVLKMKANRYCTPTRQRSKKFGLHLKIQLVLRSSIGRIFIWATRTKSEIQFEIFSRTHTYKGILPKWIGLQIRALNHYWQLGYCILSKLLGYALKETRWFMVVNFDKKEATEARKEPFGLLR